MERDSSEPGAIALKLPESKQ